MADPAGQGERHAAAAGPAGPVEAPPSALAALGGGRGLVDSALPATVFVLVRLVAPLGTAITASLAVGALLLLLRLRRGEPLQQVGSGFVGLVLAVLVARATGTGKGFFLPGIVTTALTGVAFVVSLAVRRPAVGLALAAYDARYAQWQDSPRLRRACTTATAVWALTFFVRAAVAYAVYRLPGDRDGLLLLVVNAVKWPLIAGAAALTVVLVRRAGPPDRAPAPTAPGAP